MRPFSWAVCALNALQNSMMLTPCWPSAGPTGGAGLACPPGICSLIIVRTFFAISDHRPTRSCSLPAKSKQRKDAGSARSRRLRARLRTQRCAALQPRSECEVRGEGPALLCGLQHLGEAPVLRLRQRPRLDDADDVADVRLVLRVVRLELQAAPNHLLVAPVRLDRVDLDDDRLVHRVGHDDTAAFLTAAAVDLGLRQTGDRLALGGPLTLRLRVLVPFRARQALAGSLRLGRCGGSLCRRRFRILGLGGAGLLGSLCRDVRSGRLLGSLCRDIRSGVGGGRLRRRLLAGRRLRGLFLYRWSLFRVLFVFGFAHTLPAFASRSVVTVRMRAISRFASFRRAVFSSAPVADWKRRLNRSCRRSASAPSSS